MPVFAWAPQITKSATGFTVCYNVRPAGMCVCRCVCVCVMRLGRLLPCVGLEAVLGADVRTAG